MPQEGFQIFISYGIPSDLLTSLLLILLCCGMGAVRGKCANLFVSIWGICPALMDGFGSLSSSEFSIEFTLSLSKDYIHKQREINKNTPTQIKYMQNTDRQFPSTTNYTHTRTHYTRLHSNNHMCAYSIHSPNT